MGSVCIGACDRQWRLETWISLMFRHIEQVWEPHLQDYNTVFASCQQAR